MFTDTPFSLPFVIVATVIVLSVAAWAYLRLRTTIRPAWLGGLAGLRVIALVGLVLLVLNPYRLSDEPDPDGFHVAVLIDASGSMEQRDIRDGNLSRIELVQRWLDDEEASPIAAMRENDYPLQTYLFGEETLPHTGGAVELLPGGTAIGDALLHTTRDGARQPAAVILLSDGHSNAGAPPVEAARELRQRGIPVSTIGLGALHPPGEVTVRFAEARFTGERNSPMQLPVHLSNTRGSDMEVALELHDRDGLIEEKRVTVPAGSERHLEELVVTPRDARGEGYRLVARDESGAEYSDIAAVEVTEPETFRILFLSAHPVPELRFLKQAIAEAEEITLEFIVQTGPEMFLHQLSDQNVESVPPDQFPDEASFYNEFDAILVDAGSLGELHAQGEVFQEFVARRGGGILFLGTPPDEPAEPFRTLLPIVGWEGEIPRSKRLLRLETAPVFSGISGGSLFQPPRLFLPEDLPAAVSPEVKLGARVLAELQDGSGEVMAGMAYGAGRASWLGTASTWQWRLSSETGMRQHELFWNNLLVWLASNRKPRLNFPVHGQRYPLAAEVDIGGDVMGADFRPASDARVSASIEDPGGDTRQVDLVPSFRYPGRFDAHWQPRQTGEYRVTYDIEFRDGERMEEDAFFVVSHHDLEQQSTAYREEMLRDIARVTGGEFRHYSEARHLDDPPLSNEVPTKANRHYLAGHWLFLFLLVVPLCVEWYFRRKIGLR